MTTFEIGDRVVSTIDCHPVRLGDTGVVVGFWDAYKSIVMVRWDKANNVKHNCEGKCEDKHGWNLLTSELELEFEKPIVSIPDKQLIYLL